MDDLRTVRRTRQYFLNVALYRMFQQLRYDLIKRNLNEVLNGEKNMSVPEERKLKIYWGTAPTERIHIGLTQHFLY